MKPFTASYARMIRGKQEVADMEKKIKNDLKNGKTRKIK